MHRRKCFREFVHLTDAAGHRHLHSPGKDDIHQESSNHTECLPIVVKWQLMFSDEGFDACGIATLSRGNSQDLYPQ
jgi:hypothetical protein